MPHDKELALYRVAQELLNNSIKHAEAFKIDIVIEFTYNSLILEVSDNGKGFNMEKKKASAGGIGLRNIESRIYLIKGNLDFTSKIGKGTKCSIKLPLNNNV